MRRWMSKRAASGTGDAGWPIRQRRWRCPQGQFGHRTRPLFRHNRQCCRAVARSVPFATALQHCRYVGREAEFYGRLSLRAPPSSVCRIGDRDIASSPTLPASTPPPTRSPLRVRLRSPLLPGSSLGETGQGPGPCRQAPQPVPRLVGRPRTREVLGGHVPGWHARRCSSSDERWLPRQAEARLA